MVRIYYEAMERLAPGEADKGIEGDYCRVDVTALNEEQRAAVLAYFKELIPDGCYQQHVCFHIEGKPCEVTPL